MKSNFEIREQREAETQKKVSKRRRSNMPLIIIGTLLLIITTGAAGYFYKQVTDLKKISTTNLASADENQATIDAVSKLILVPAGEKPTIATVTDPDKLKDQVFFTNAKIGDKVLIYTDAKKAILYSPSENKIIEVAPLNTDQTPAVSGDTTANIRGTTPDANKPDTSTPSTKTK